MKNYLIAYDFGTGGIKASLYDREGNSKASSFEAYDTYYPNVGWYEQRPAEWWASICISTKRLIATAGVDKSDIEAMAISGHSLGVVPLDKNGGLLRESVPIWSDTRAQREAAEFFKTQDYASWYMQTGNGFPAHLYSAFKIMWYRQNEPDIYAQIDTILGTKDYINYLLTGIKLTDHSYASGCGFYDLKRAEYDEGLLRAMELPRSMFPDIAASTHVLGTLSKKAAEQTGLPESVKVICGGVDNSCMALGARGIYDGRVYTSLGSSSWIAVTSHEPLLDTRISPFVFAHVIPGMYASATSIFSAGSSLQWVRNEICRDIKRDYENPYDRMNELAASVPLGSNKLLFNPSLAGGTGADKSPNIRGAFIGLDLKHNQADMIRAAMEGIALSLRVSLDNLKKMCSLTDEMLFVGGGANSELWLQIFADVYGMDILKTNVGQEAGSLGAAALAAVGCGMWNDFSIIDSIHSAVSRHTPDESAMTQYGKLLDIYQKATGYLADIGDLLYNLELS